MANTINYQDDTINKLRLKLKIKL